MLEHAFADQFLIQRDSHLLQEYPNDEQMSLFPLVLWAYVLWEFVLWAFVLWAFVLWAFVLWAYVCAPLCDNASGSVRVTADFDSDS